MGETDPVNVGLLHPGEMGAAVAALLRLKGERVVWASEGRSAETAERAEAAGIERVETVEELCQGSEVVISLVPPHAAVELARMVEGFGGIYVDANAISPVTARLIADMHHRFVDGGVIGPPPHEPGTTRLYLAGAEAGTVAALFSGTALEARVLDGEPGSASALKMTFAAWTKGTAALLLATSAVAEANGVENALLEEWRQSLPHLDEQLHAAARSAVGKGWRWIGEMEEIARTFDVAGLPSGFHSAAAEVYRRVRREAPGRSSLEHVLGDLFAPSDS